MSFIFGKFRFFPLQILLKVPKNSYFSRNRSNHRGSSNILLTHVKTFQSYNSRVECDRKLTFSTSLGNNEDGIKKKFHPDWFIGARVILKNILKHDGKMDMQFINIQLYCVFNFLKLQLNS